MSAGRTFPPFVPDAFKLKDAGSYDELAYLYDQHIRRLAAPLADHICDLARIGRGDAVLDVATGSGIAARRAAQRVGPSGTVLGVDLSAGMIQVASQSPVPHGAGALSFRVMDAERLGLANESADAVISLCAVLHFPDLPAALSEMVRVARSEARVVLSYGHARPIRPAPLGRHLARRAAGRVLRPRTPSMQAPTAALAMLSQASIPEQADTILAWTRRRPGATVVREMRRIGLTDISTGWRGHQVRYDDPNEFWQAHAAISTRLRKSLDAAPPERVEQLRRAFTTRAREVLSRGGSLWYPYGAVFVSGTRSASVG